MSASHCHTCRCPIAGYESVHYGSAESGYRDLCWRCFNEEVARAGGLRFEHIAFEPIELADATGQRHQFHFRVRLLGDHVTLDAFELRDGDPAGYEFHATGDPEGDLFALLAQLIERMRRALATRHLKEDERCGVLSIADMLVRGQIGWDSAEGGRVPLLVIDGREVTWEEFGRMLMTFEGWQFKLEIREPSEEI
jgi:hypothetical protein